MVVVRIVSLLPSATEILFELGLGDDVVGVTFECDMPPQARERRIVSTSALPEGLGPSEIDAVVRQRIAAGEDLYRLDRGALAELDPTMIVTQDLCAVCAVDLADVDDALDYLGCGADVLTLDPLTLEEVLESVLTVGQATGTQAAAAAVVTRCRDRLAAVRSSIAGEPARSTLVLEWTAPAFTAGHWVPDLVTEAGGRPVLARPGADSVSVAWSEVAACAAEVVLVAPCGYHLDGAADLAANVVAQGVLPPGAEVWAVDADAIIVRPGPRLVEGVAAIAAVLHPDRAGPPSPDAARRIA
jgi:iron complex transport system substrate-binding protein